MDPVEVVLIKTFHFVKSVRTGFLRAFGKRFGYMLQEAPDPFIYFRDTMELFIADPGIDTKIREVNIVLHCWFVLWLAGAGCHKVGIIMHSPLIGQLLELIFVSLVFTNKLFHVIA